MRLTKAQGRALNKIIKHGDWLLLSEINETQKIVDPLVDLDLVERHTVAGLSEYKSRYRPLKGIDMSNIISNDPAICPHGESWYKCKMKECINEMIRAEDAATCPHGYLVGCPACTQAAIHEHK